jgi:hypothetical protein
MRVLSALAHGALMLAALLLLLLLGVAVGPEARGPDAATGRLTAVTLLALPFWCCLSLAAGVATARGGFDWLAAGRGARYALVLSACTAVAVVTWLSAGLRHEPPDQIPWAVRPLVSWALFVVPTAGLAAVLLALRPALRESVPPLAFRGLVLAVGGVALATGAGLLGQWLVASQQRAAARVEASLREQERRDRQVLAEVEAMDPIADFGPLLGFTSRLESEPIRTLALRKVLSHPSLAEELAARVRDGWSGEVLTFLESNDPPEPRAVAETARAAMLGVAAHVRDRMQNAHWLYDDSFDSAVRRVLAVADKLAGHGVDYVPAVRAVRAALDVPRRQRIEPRCVRTLDRWLAGHAPG